MSNEPHVAGVTSESTPRLRISGISKHFEAVRALNDVSFDFAAGEIHALVGENGAGKSTLVGVITGLLTPDAGAVELDGKSVRFRNPLEARASGVTAVFQDPNLFPHLSVAENIFTGNYPRSGALVDRKAMTRDAQAKLSDLGFDLDVDQLVAGLTVAETQFVEIARAVDTGLKVLILDEPTSALTPSEAEKLYAVARRLKALGTTVVWISHRMEEVRFLADTITVLRDGGHVQTSPASELDDSTMIRLMVGRSVVLDRVARTEPVGPPRLAVEHLSLAGVFDDISFQVAEGEIVGVAGLVGAGRSEIAQGIFGLSPRMTGIVRIGDKQVKPRSPAEMAEHGVVYLPEDRDAEGIISSLSIAANIALPSTHRLSRFGFMQSRQERELASQQSAALSIKGRVQDPVSSLSGGNRQKVALARWLATDPRVLLLDEPTHGIDVGTKAQVHDIMRALARERRMAILMISSDLPEILAVSDRVLVIARGRLAADIPIAEATQERILAAATGASNRKDAVA
ncbi:D-xylose ABC transporter ATP-binding protein (plasmid) [Cellulomonas sp. WB94]|nr:D-xylose ABC transporter ATP-binding protein [Cellulomonas sp. WB94]